MHNTCGPRWRTNLQRRRRCSGAQPTEKKHTTAQNPASHSTNQQTENAINALLADAKSCYQQLYYVHAIEWRNQLNKTRDRDAFAIALAFGRNAEQIRRIIFITFRFDGFIERSCTHRVANWKYRSEWGSSILYRVCLSHSHAIRQATI